MVEREAGVRGRDRPGSLTGTEKRQLGARRMVVVTAPSAEARQRPEDGAPVAFVAAPFVALELLEFAPAGWLRVRHPDGANGYVRATLVWGA